MQDSACSDRSDRRRSHLRVCREGPLAGGTASTDLPRPISATGECPASGSIYPATGGGEWEPIPKGQYIEFVIVAQCSYTGLMKTEVVRARIETDLKVQAGAVLADSGLEMSDAIRLFLRQVVRIGGLPFSVKSTVRVVSAKRLRQMKRASQTRDRQLVARGELSAEDVMLVKPKALRGASIRWPTAKLSD